MNQAVDHQYRRVGKARQRLHLAVRDFCKEAASRDRKLRAISDALLEASDAPSGHLVESAVSLSPEMDALINDPTRGLDH